MCWSIKTPVAVELCLLMSQQDLYCKAIWASYPLGQSKFYSIILRKNGPNPFDAVLSFNCSRNLNFWRWLYLTFTASKRYKFRPFKSCLNTSYLMFRLRLLNITFTITNTIIPICAQFCLFLHFLIFSLSSVTRFGDL